MTLLTISLISGFYYLRRIFDKPKNNFTIRREYSGYLAHVTSTEINNIFRGFLAENGLSIQMLYDDYGNKEIIIK